MRLALIRRSAPALNYRLLQPPADNNELPVASAAGRLTRPEYSYRRTTAILNCSKFAFIIILTI